MKGPASKEGSKDGGKRRRKLLSEDDRALWEMVAARLEPARGKSRVRDVEPDLEALAIEIDVPSAQAEKRTARLPSSPGKSAKPQRAAPSPEPQLVQLERRRARRIARGAEEIEARLDLHGMTQDDAHATLVGFVRRCHASGLRTVLVITGKGAPSRHSRDDDEVVPRARGVLRRNVPRWLGGAEVGALVISYSTAQQRHGGEGALYVRLRRNS